MRVVLKWALVMILVVSLIQLSPTASAADGTQIFNSSYTMSGDRLGAYANDDELYVGQNTFPSKRPTLDVTYSTLQVVTNTPPEAQDGTLIVIEDTPKNGTLIATDVEGDSLTYSLLTPGGKGILVITNAATGAYKYTPNPNATGADSFTFRAYDGSLYSNTATVTITIAEVNDAPVAQNGTLTVTEDIPEMGTLIATDVDGDSLTYSVVTQGTKGVVTITDTATGTYTYTPYANATGADSFTFKVHDGVLDSNTATVAVSITEVNDAPILSDITDKRTYTHVPITIPFIAEDVETELTDLIITATSNNQLLVPDANIIVDVVTQTLKITPGSRVGTVTITVTVIDVAGLMTTDTFDLVIETPPSTHTLPDIPAEDSIDIRLDGILQEQYARGSTSQQGGQKITTITFDIKKLLTQINKQKSKDIFLSYIDNSDAIVILMDGSIIDELKKNGGQVVLETKQGTYQLPVSSIDMNQLLKSFDSNATLQDIEFALKISLASKQNQELMESASKRQGMELIGQPVQFEIVATHNNQKVVIKEFLNFVKRIIPFPNNMDASGITTAVVMDGKGQVHHIPTAVMQQNNKYYAVINSLYSDGFYSLVRNPKSFTDVTEHWSQADINEMGSRFIINGVTENTFEPAKPITRAEFASIIVRALGLMNSNDEKRIAYNDVSIESWYDKFVQIASRNGLVSGYEDGTFKPQKTINRMEAMVILSRAMKIANLDVIEDSQNAEQLLQQFSDFNQISKWAYEAMASNVQHEITQGYNNMLQPQAEITRAQTASMIRRLLQKANLIN